ncbi:MAG: hypothetical protein IKA80_00125 [Spirochaetaceae bacterium]|nr:hypothetical protein [Spirochaetaceae bacterium]
MSDKRDAAAETLTAKDYYNRLWHCRDFESSHLWQRTIFIAGFMVAIATGYGSFVNQHFKEMAYYILVLLDKTCEKDAVPLCFATNSVALFLSCIGLILSLLWILMGKGSKLWYKAYEVAICTMETSIYGDDSDLQKVLVDDGFAEYGEKYNDTFPWFGELKHTKCDDSPFSTAAGRFSVSKINIFLGQLAFCVWFVLGMVHLFSVLNYLCCDVVFCVCVSFVTMVVFCCVVHLIVLEKTKSQVQGGEVL